MTSGSEELRNRMENETSRGLSQRTSGREFFETHFEQ